MTDLSVSPRDCLAYSHGIFYRKERGLSTRENLTLALFFCLLCGIILMLFVSLEEIDNAASKEQFHGI